MTTYHGTGAENIKSILQNWLKAKKPYGANIKGVYITNNIEGAAYYVHKYNHPIVLEVRIASPKRVKRIMHDPLDRDNRFEYHLGDEDIRALQKRIKRILQIDNFVLHSEFKFLNRELESVAGNNIYKAILTSARNSGLDIIKVKERIKEELPPKTSFEYIEIAQDGTLLLTDFAYDQMHQAIYPQDLPAKAIKAVWIPASNLKPEYHHLASKSKNFGQKLLPGEVESISNSINNLISWIYRIKNFDQKSAEEAIDELESMNIHDLLSEDIVRLREIANEEIASEEMKEKFLHVLELAANEDLGSFEIPVVNKQTWLRLDVNSINLNNILTYYI